MTYSQERGFLRETTIRSNQVLNGEENIKALIEVAQSVHPRLEHVDAAKLVQCFLYSDYLFRISEDKTKQSFYTVLTDAYSWHQESIIKTVKGKECESPTF